MLKTIKEKVRAFFDKKNRPGVAFVPVIAPGKHVVIAENPCAALPKLEIPKASVFTTENDTKKTVNNHQKDALNHQLDAVVYAIGSAAPAHKKIDQAQFFRKKKTQKRHWCKWKKRNK